MPEDKGLLRRYAQGERNFSGENFQGIKLYGSQGREINLSEANFTGANLENAILSHINLNNANLSRANLKNARINGKVNNTNFSQADLSNANLSACRLNESQFVGANLTNANFGTNIKLKNTKLRNTNLDFREANCTDTKLTCNLAAANFQGANLTKAVFRIQNRYWYRANLEAANLSNQNLAGQNFSSLNLKDANLSNSNLAGANLRGTNLENANLSNTNLEGADLTRANLRNTQIEGATGLSEKTYLTWQVINQGAASQNLQNVDLSAVDLSEIDFNGIDLSGINFQATNLVKANLSNTNLAGANLSKAILNQANLEKANLSQAHLGGANLANANLNQVNFDHAYLLGVTLEKANLESASLKNANLTDANLEGANLTGADLTDADLTGAKLFEANFANAIRTPGLTSLFDNSPDNPNLELLNHLREATQGLYYPSDADYPYHIFLWETANLGEFTLEGLLRAFGHLREINANTFINGDFDQMDWLQSSSYYLKTNQEQEIITTFRNTLTQIEPFLSNLKVLRLMNSFYLIIANTPSGDWLGISTKVSSYLEQDHYSSQVFRFRDLAVSKPENQELIIALENAIADVSFSSEYLLNLVWEIAESQEGLMHNLLDSMRITTTNEVEHIFHSYYEEENEASQEKDADNTAISNLTNLRLYRLSEGQIDMYFVGKIENGDWLIIQTKAVET